MKSSAKPGRPRQPGSARPGGSSFAHAVAILLFAVVGLLVYSNSLDGEMLFDDVPHLVGSTDLHDLTAVHKWWNHDPSRPLGYLTLALNYHFHGLSVRGYHLTNLVIHILNASLVYWLLLLTFSMPTLQPRPAPRPRQIMALFGGLIFLTHPLQTQAVSYIVQRLASQATLFYLLALALYVIARIRQGSVTSRVLCYAGSAVAGVIAMLTKQTAFTLPLAIVLYELCFLYQGQWRQDLKNVRVWAGIAVILGGLLVVPASMSFDVSRVLGTIPPEHGHDYTLTPATYFFTQCRVLITYLRLLVLPINQNLDYDYPIASTLLDWRTLASLVALLAILAVAAWSFRKNRLVAVGCFWFFLTLSVESSFIPIADVIFEHRLYLPMFGVCMAVTGLLIARPAAYVNVILTCIVLMLGIAAHLRNEVWRDELSLWSDVARKAPDNPRANTNLGHVYMLRGEPVLAERYLTRAVEINPDYAEAQSNLGSFYRENRQTERAEQHLQRAVSLDPSNALAHYNLGTLYLGLRQFEPAEQHLKKAIELFPEFADAYANLGNGLYERGADDGAQFYSERAVALDPRHHRAYTNLGRVWKRKGDLAKAVSYYERAYEIEPRSLDNLVNLGNAALTEKRLPVAEEWYRRALAIDGRYVGALNGMGLVHYYLGDYDVAVKYLQDAQAANPNVADTYNNLALCYRAMGRANEAMVWYEAGRRLRQQ